VPPAASTRVPTTSTIGRLRIADRGATIRQIPETVAEWRIHPLGLSGKVLDVAAMKRRILSLFEQLQRCLSGGNASAVAAAQQVVAASDIVTYDDYVNAMAEAREKLATDAA
jgi:hypothetical protein